ncbi:MAG TPA: hypothetical protein VII75_11665 [Thermoanaerobaculia bacterium]|jgi:hypothetical protein
MAKITWFNKTAKTPVEWMLSVHHQQPSTGSLDPGKKHEEQRVDRSEAGVRCLGFTGAVAFAENADRDLDVIIGD